MKRTVFAMLLPLLLAACKPGLPDESADVARARSVIVQVVQPQPLAVKIKLPVLIRPSEELELRAAAPGKLISLPYREGDVVPASVIPPAKWLEVEEFMAARPAGSPQPTQDEIEFRNLTHLAGFDCFARVDDAALLQSFREAQVGYDQAVRDLRRVEEYPESTGAQLDGARSRRSMARASAERALSMIHDTRINSPLSGILVDRLRHPGEYVNGGELVGRVAVMDVLVAELEIPEAHRQAIVIGSLLDVTIGALRGQDDKPLVRSARVARMDSVAHSVTHSFTVELEIDNADLSLPAGTFGTVYVTTYSTGNALVVPLSAVKLNGEQKSLVVVSAENDMTVIELKDVELGHFSLEWVEIRSGLKPGMRVITFGAQSVSGGDTVTWVEQEAYTVSADP